MKKALLIFTLIFTTFVSVNFAQKNVDQQIQRDPILEADAKHNLDVSWYHFKLKKAYIAVLLRFEETFAAHPDFSKMDEFLYLAAMSSKNLADGKGEQKIILSKLPEEERKKYEPAKLREDAVAYFSLIKDKYPQSKYIGETEKQLKLLQPKK